MGLSPSPSSPEGRWDDLPDDIAVAVASRLQVRLSHRPLCTCVARSSIYVARSLTGSSREQEADVCALGGCSRSWRRACDANFVWEGLFRRRWPATAAAMAAGGAGASRAQVGTDCREQNTALLSIPPSLFLSWVHSSCGFGHLVVGTVFT
uniref:F-box domain-containing protein n=1 Tax=Aegilops tauschii subsp. strangulata TaxID=200361 RepID=A0A452YZ07_AEGTS